MGDASDVMGFDVEAAPDADATADDQMITETEVVEVQPETLEETVADTSLETEVFDDTEVIDETVADVDPDTNDADAVEDVDPDLGDTAPEIADETFADDTIADDTIADDTIAETDDVASSCPLGPELHDELWGDLDPLSDAPLRAELRDRVDDMAGQDYGAARDLMYVTADIDVRADGFIECIYTGTLVHEDGTRSPGVITTEHSWPRSDGADVFPAEGDVHHLFPATDTSNNRRGNDEFGETTCGHAGQSPCPWGEAGSLSGPATDGRSRVFEVRPQYRGDVARAHFYFAVRYGLPIPPLEEAVLRKWHVEDPPDDVERARNDRIALWLLNRNPFVDQPCMLDRITDY